MDAFLIIDTQVYPIKGEKITIGRHLENNIVIQDTTISRQHAQILLTNDRRYIIKDLGSTGGTYVNGSKVIECMLHSGDSILLAGTPVVFVQNAPGLAKVAKDETGPLDAPGYDEEQTLLTNKLIWRGEGDRDSGDTTH